MKKILSKKILALILLLTTVFAFTVPLAHAPLSAAYAQDVQLLPNASPKDVKIETNPYQGQEYQVQTAGFAEDVRSWIVDNTLGKMVNAGLSLTGESLAKWIPDVMHFSIVALYGLLNGPEGLHGSGWCTSTEDNCWDDPETKQPEYIPERKGNYCQCIPNPDLITTYNPSNHGMVGVMGAMTMGALRQGPPDMHLAQYIKSELADNLVSTPAYAKTGVSYFDPVNQLWKIMRNVAYTLMVIILVAMGFMVMMRKQVDPRTVMTVTAALPKIAVSLVLIAFSYPIAGLLVDIGRLGKGLIDATFGSVMALHVVEPFQMVVDLLGNFVSVNIITQQIWGQWGNISLGGAGIFAFAIQCGISIIAIVIAFMLFFTLVFRFAGLFMQVVFAPLAFAWGALPGQGDTISRWFKSFAVNVLCFPAIYFMVNLANFIAVYTLDPLNRFELPADLGWGAINPNVQTNVGGLVAFGLLMAATKVPAMLEDAFEVTAPAGVSRAGVEPGKILGRLPFVGKMLK